MGAETSLLGALRQDTVIDRYVVEHELGSGAFGTVYSARDREGGQRVALKHLSRMSASALGRFKREFRALQGLHHPRVVRLDALFEHESGWFIAMEYVPGEDLLDHVGRGAEDAARPRLRDAFLQLADALDALHAHGIIHRDLKPANVRVTPQGRVVLLDFGLVTSLDNTAQSDGLVAAGTPAYMAPEQAAAGELEAAADWYAFGVCMYEALTDSLPFCGATPVATMLAKQHKLPEPPSHRIAGEVPEDLESLCMALLDPSPAERPGLPEVQRVLGQGAADRPSLTEPQEVFEGRERELQRLDAAHAMASSQGLRVLLVEGESGIGKSRLVEEWLQRLRQRTDGILILQSRCYENERSAFKAFDAGMEELARWFASPEGERRLVVPPHAGLVPRLFPALASLEALRAAPLHDLPADPSSALRCGLMAVAHLIHVAAACVPMVVMIDDLQWADPESFRLLRTLGESPHAPPVLIVATVRPEAELGAEIRSAVTRLADQMPVEVLSLQGLSAQACRRLASQLMGSEAPPGWLERITRESKGLPLLVSVLSGHASSQKPESGGELSLESALASKLQALDDNASNLLNVVAISVAPCSLGLLARALRQDPEQVQLSLGALMHAKLVRAAPDQRLACFHDRLKAIIESTLVEEQVRHLHGALADAIASRPDHDPSVVAEHLERAARHERAQQAHQHAADAALSALAFGKAAYHYRRALALCEAVDASLPRATLQARLGDALARAGLSAQAAEQYRLAALEADEAERIPLCTLAAQHLLQGARFGQGVAATRDVLAELDAPLAGTEAAAIARILRNRLWLRIRGLHLGRNRGAATDIEHARLEAMRQLAVPLFYVNVPVATALNMAHLRRSLVAGNEEHAARALASEAVMRSMQHPEGAPREHEALLGRALALSGSDPPVALRAWLEYCRATCGNLRGEPAPTAQLLAQVEKLLTQRCPEEPWLLLLTRQSLCAAWAQLGSFGTKLPLMERWLAECRERNDRFGVALLETIGLCSLRFVVLDEPERVGPCVREAMSPWPREPFTVPHLGELMCEQFAATYRGGTSAWELLCEDRQRTRRALVLRAGFGEAVLNVHQAHAALSAHAACGKGARANQLLDAARMHARRVRRCRAPQARRYAPLIDAQLLALEGNNDLALEKAREAADQVRRQQYLHLLPPVTYFAGLLEGGDAGRKKRTEALSMARKQGWTDPRRFVAMDCPTIDWVEAR